MEESKNLNHDFVGSEHILLGLLREQEGVAALVLNNYGVSLEESRSEILALLGPGISALSKRWELETNGVFEKIAAEPHAACPHCGRPYRARWNWSPMRFLRRLFGR
jgi:ATP-dependent Clp protease ATP-binding subunit ClpA